MKKFIKKSIAPKYTRSIQIITKARPQKKPNKPTKPSKPETLREYMTLHDVRFAILSNISQTVLETFLKE